MFKRAQRKSRGRSPRDFPWAQAIFHCIPNNVMFPINLILVPIKLIFTCTCTRCSDLLELGTFLVVLTVVVVVLAVAVVMVVIVVMVVVVVVVVVMLAQQIAAQ